MATDGSVRSSSATLVDPAPVEPHSAVKSASSVFTRLAFSLVFVAVVVALLALFVRILKIDNGTFVYTLDDPYIHLALSDQIRHGNYGLYPGTHAAPSSSILFPFLLALASGTPLHPYFPLLLNVCALFATIEIMRRSLLHLKLGRSTFAIGAQALLLLLMTFCFNLIGVVFTGGWNTACTSLSSPPSCTESRFSSTAGACPAGFPQSSSSALSSVMKGWLSA